MLQPTLAKADGNHCNA